MGFWSKLLRIENFLLLVALDLFISGYFRIKFAFQSFEINALANTFDYADTVYVISYGQKGLLYFIFGIIFLGWFFVIKLLDKKK